MVPLSRILWSPKLDFINLTTFPFALTFYVLLQYFLPSQAEIGPYTVGGKICSHLKLQKAVIMNVRTFSPIFFFFMYLSQPTIRQTVQSSLTPASLGHSKGSLSLTSLRLFGTCSLPIFCLLVHMSHNLFRSIRQFILDGTPRPLFEFLLLS